MFSRTAQSHKRCPPPPHPRAQSPSAAPVPIRFADGRCTLASALTELLYSEQVFFAGGSKLGGGVGAGPGLDVRKVQGGHPLFLTGGQVVRTPPSARGIWSDPGEGLPGPPKGRSPAPGWGAKAKKKGKMTFWAFFEEKNVKNAKKSSAQKHWIEKYGKSSKGVRGGEVQLAAFFPASSLGDEVLCGLRDAHYWTKFWVQKLFSATWHGEIEIHL